MADCSSRTLLLAVILCSFFNCVHGTDVQKQKRFITDNGLFSGYSWSSWSKTSSCNGTCETGHISVRGHLCRQRTCQHVHSANSSHSVNIHYCDANLHNGDSSRIQTSCDGHACTFHCPDVNGAWSSWQTWSACSVTIGTGIQVRQRSCTHPSPLGRGANCAGLSTNTMSCSLNIWSTWSSWSACPVTCSEGIRFRVRHCVNGTSCIGNIVEQAVCTKPRCIHLIDGSWGSWSAWGRCSQTCGNGVNLRTRHCDSPAPQDGGKNCTGSEDDFQICHLAECPIDGGWSNFTDKPCSVSCGVGLLVAVRQCNNPVPAYGGSSCQGPPTQFSTCTLPECVVDGGWTEWSDYSDCHVICGYGHQRRERNCTAPEPRNGGEPCTGDAIDNMECYNGKCPLDIKTCDKDKVKSAAAHGTTAMYNGQSVCDDKIHANQESLIEALCNTTGDSSEWKLGLKISDGCDIIPLYSPVGYQNMATKAISYGIMMNCHGNAMLVATQSCNSGVHFSNIDLSPNGTDYHMLLW